MEGGVECSGVEWVVRYSRIPQLVADFLHLSVAKWRWLVYFSNQFLSGFACSKCGQLIHSFNAIMHQIRFQLRFHLRLAGLFTPLSRPLAGFQRPISKGREGKVKEQEGRGREQSNRGREEGGGDGRPSEFVLPVVVITEGYRRMPKDTESYRRLPKACLKIEYRPSVSGVVANLERWNAWGPPSGVQGWSGGQGASPLKLKAFLLLDIPS